MFGITIAVEQKSQYAPVAGEQAARKQAAEARRATNERKMRTRALIRMGGVAAAFGFESPSQVEELLEAVLASGAGQARVLGLGVTPTSRWPGSPELE